MTAETHSQLANFIWSICNLRIGLTILLDGRERPRRRFFYARVKRLLKPVPEQCDRIVTELGFDNHRHEGEKLASRAQRDGLGQMLPSLDEFLETGDVASRGADAFQGDLEVLQSSCDGETEVVLSF